MKEQDKNIELPEESETKTREFSLENRSAVSSAEMVKEILAENGEEISSSEKDAAQDFEEIKPEIQSESAEEVDPIFAALAQPVLPELPKENRARLQMQSPTKINFYWSVKQNPYKTLNRVFGGSTGSYTLTAKLVNQTNGREEIFPVEAEGSWWFDVDADSVYRAEIGFYAPNRPFVRVLFSNKIETPRLNPSPRRANSADWAISANQFADVLDASGFAQDAFEVALAGDDFERTETATTKAFTQFVGRQKESFPSDEIRFALLALASGYALESLRDQIGSTLFAFLQKNSGKLNADDALKAIEENFEVFSDEITEEKFTGKIVFGASLVNFPKSRRKRIVPKILAPKGKPKLFRKLSSFSSFSIR